MAFRVFSQPNYTLIIYINYYRKNNYVEVTIL